MECCPELRTVSAVDGTVVVDVAHLAGAGMECIHVETVQLQNLVADIVIVILVVSRILCLNLCGRTEEPVLCALPCRISVEPVAADFDQCPSVCRAVSDGCIKTCALQQVSISECLILADASVGNQRVFADAGADSFVDKVLGAGTVEDTCNLAVMSYAVSFCCPYYGT